MQSNEITQFAINRHGLLVSARLALAEDRPFTCVCPAHHQVKLGQPSGLEGKRPFKPYFAHVTQPTSHKRDSEGALITGSVCQGGESEEHMLGKLLLRDHVGQYAFNLRECSDCGASLTSVDTSGCQVALEMRVDGALWRYDCLLQRDGINVAAMEVLKTHKTTQPKILDTRAHGLPLAEFSCDKLLAVLADAGPSTKVTLHNQLVDKAPCAPCQAQAVLKRARMLETKAKADQALAIVKAKQREGWAQQSKARQANSDKETLLKHWQEQLNAEITQAQFLDGARYALYKQLDASPSVSNPNAGYLEGKVSDYAPPCMWADLQEALSQPGAPTRSAVKRSLYAELDRAWLAEAGCATRPS